ncbi:hypothetical protein PC116_g33424 [Phytophthora cactorum]|nr:hypothetical protein PC116_g33424 [Phytophthora cactorum]
MGVLPVGTMGLLMRLILVLLMLRQLLMMLLTVRRVQLGAGVRRLRRITSKLIPT